MKKKKKKKQKKEKKKKKKQKKEKKKKQIEEEEEEEGEEEEQQQENEAVISKIQSKLVSTPSICKVGVTGVIARSRLSQGVCRFLRVVYKVLQVRKQRTYVRTGQ